MKLGQLLILLIYFLNAGYPLKILIYSPAIGHSHLQFVGTLADILVDAGHYVHVIIPEWDPRLIKNGTAKAHQITRLKPSIPSTYSTMQFMSNPFGERQTMRLSEARIFQDLAIQFCKDVLNSVELINELRAKQYDVGMTEYYEYCPIGLFKVLNIKSTVLLSATPLNDLLAESWGIPSPTSYVTNVFDSSVNAPDLDFNERLHNFISYFFGRFMFYGRLYNAENALFKEKISKDFPDLRRLAQRAGVAFINALPVFEIPRPVSSKVVYIGGIANNRPIQPLDEEIIDIFEKSKKGAVLFSMGSIADPKKMPNTTRDSLLEAFSKFPDYEFIVKMKRPDGTKAAEYENIHFFDWIDQISLLNHPLIKAFISHVGLNSLTEAAFAGTPVICTPLFGDQEYNTAIALKEGNGVYLDIRNTNTKQIYDALDKVLNTPKYMAAAKHLQKRLLQYPHNITNLFVKWTEYVAKFDDFSTLNLHGANLDYFRYYSLDVISFILSIGFTAVVTVLFLIYYSLKYFLRLVKTKKD